MGGSSPRFAKFSIIIPIYNRLSEIRELLESMQALEFPRERFELLVVDDGSTNETPAFVEDFREKCDFNLRLLRQQNQGPSAARDTGMSQADGDFFIFLDSDCTVPSEWLTEIDKHLTAEEGDAFGGPDIYHDDFPPFVKAINYAMTSFITTGGIRGHSKKKLGKYYPRTFNMGLSRAVWEKIGGFSGMRYGEDVEMAYRIHGAGAKVLNILSAAAYHKRRTSLWRFFRQIYYSGSARIDLSIIDPKLMEFVFYLPALATLILTSMIIGSLLSDQIWMFSKPLFLLGITALVLSGIHAAIRYKDILAGFWVPLTIPTQVLGYGIGFIHNWFRRKVLGSTRLTGL